MLNEIKLFDEFLAQKEITFKAIVIGGAALNLMGVIVRETHDVDFLDPEIPEDVKRASVEFALKNKSLKLNPAEWINNGPASLKRDLPLGWRDNLQVIFKGEALTLFTLGRLNLLRTKLYAYADRGTDYKDCIALAPTLKELNDCKEWVIKGDASDLWPERVEEIYSRLIKDLKLE